MDKEQKKIPTCKQCNKIFPELIMRAEEFTCYDCRYNKKFIECKKCGFVMHETYWNDYKKNGLNGDDPIFENIDLIKLFNTLMKNSELYCYSCCIELAVRIYQISDY